jgi:hypothetical protein
MSPKILVIYILYRLLKILLFWKNNLDGKHFPLTLALSLQGRGEKSL